MLQQKKQKERPVHLLPFSPLLSHFSAAPASPVLCAATARKGGGVTKAVPEDVNIATPRKIAKMRPHRHKYF